MSISLGRVPKLPNGKHVLSGGTNIYIYDGKKHRERGPAEENKRTGYKAWYRHGLLHKEDGPAVITTKYLEYWEDGKFILKVKKENDSK